ncbi:MAG: DNRLRE domain-containing protein, partial [Candidatus Kariarchaeaceae archaeon]
MIGPLRYVNDNGVYKEFTELVKMGFESGNLTYSYKKDYSVVSRLMFIIDIPKDVCKDNGWDWSNKDEACFLWPDEAREFMELYGVNYDVVINKNLGYYKYALNISGIPFEYQDKLLYVGLHLDKAKGLKWDDVREKKNEKSLDINNIRLSFNDLIESGFRVELYDKRTILIGNVRNKEDLWLDPLTGFIGNKSDGYISGENTNYETARSDSAGGTASTSTIFIGQDTDGGSPDYLVYRGYVDFNTSSIDDGATVTDVKLSLEVSSDSSLTDFDVQISDFNWQEPLTSNRESNYDAVGATYDADWRNTNGMNLNEYYNSSSLNNAWVNLTGNTKYQLRSSRDNSSTQPSGDEYIRVYSAESAGNEPILWVTYTTCTADSGACNQGADCCSTYCVGGFCESTCDVDGEACSDGAYDYNSASGGQCLAGGGACDTTDPIRMDCVGLCSLGETTYDDCTTTSGHSCDSVMGGSNFNQDGTCAELATNDCDTSGHVCYDTGQSRYEADCSDCGVTSSDADRCDTSVTGGDYSANGVCVTANTCATGTIHNNEGTLTNSCSAGASGDEDPCDSDASDGYTAGGICVNGNSCDSVDVALDTNFYGNCDGHGGKQCDTSVTGGDYAQNGMCFDDG